MSTDYAETAMLVAQMEGDTDRVEELLADMFPGEKQHLIVHLELLLDRMQNRCETCGRHVAASEAITLRPLVVSLHGERKQYHRACLPPATESSP